MNNIAVKIGRDRYKSTVTAGNNTLIADEPASLGGTDKGMSPFELLAASLGTCTAITLRMYADRKEFALDGVNVVLSYVEEKAQLVSVKREISLEGDLTDQERKRLLQLANACPVHKALANAPFSIETVLV